MARKVKHIRGKSAAPAPQRKYKPVLYLQDDQIPKDLGALPPGASTAVTILARILRRSEGVGGTSSLDLEISGIKPLAKKRR